MGTIIISSSFGGAGTTAAWTKRALDTEEINTITGAVFDNANDEIDLPAGTYDIDCYCTQWKGDSVGTRLYNTTDGAAILYGGHGYAENAANYSSVVLPLKGRFTLAAAKTIELQYYMSSTGELGNGPAGGGSTRAVFIRITEV